MSTTMYLPPTFSADLAAAEIVQHSRLGTCDLSIIPSPRYPLSDVEIATGLTKTAALLQSLHVKQAE